MSGRIAWTVRGARDRNRHGGNRDREQDSEKHPNEWFAACVHLRPFYSGGAPITTGRIHENSAAQPTFWG